MCGACIFPQIQPTVNINGATLFNPRVPEVGESMIATREYIDSRHSAVAANDRSAAAPQSRQRRSAEISPSVASSLPSAPKHAAGSLADRAAKPETGAPQLQSLSIVSDETLDLISHQLKTPLTTFKLWAYHLGCHLAPLDTPLANDMVERVALIDASAIALAAMIDALVTDAAADPRRYVEAGAT